MQRSAVVAEQSEAVHPVGGWVLAGLARRLYHGFRTGWHRLPPGAARRWLVVLAAGAVLAALFTAGLVWAGQRLEATNLLAWEADVLRWLQDRIGLRTALWVEIPGNTIVALPVLLFAAGWAAWHARPLRALTLVIGVALYKLDILMAWGMWNRTRPSAGVGLDLWQGWSGYPSGHVVQVVFVYGFLVYLWMRRSRSGPERLLAGFVLLLLIAGSAVGRMRVGAHWPLDVLAGIPIGAAWLAVALAALRLSGKERNPAAPPPLDTAV